MKNIIAFFSITTKPKWMIIFTTNTTIPYERRWTLLQANIINTADMRLNN